MAIASFPNGIKPTTMNITSEFQTVVTNSHNFSRQSRTRGGQRWKIEYNYPTLTRSQIAPLLGFLQAQNGRAGQFDIDPAKSLFTNTGDTKLASAISPIANYASTPTGGGIVVERLAGNTAFDSNTDKIEAGTFIKFDNHDKVYMTTQALEILGAATFSSSSVTIENKRDTNSPKQSGSLRITLKAIDVTGTANDSVEKILDVETLASDSASQIAVKVSNAVNAIGGFSSSVSGNVVTVNVMRKTGTGTTANGRKVYVQDLVRASNGNTGIRTAIDNFLVIGGSSPAVLYFDPPLREPILSTTAISIAPLNSVPFNVSLVEDTWSTSIDELQHYTGFSITFQETF